MRTRTACPVGFSCRSSIGGSPFSPFTSCAELTPSLPPPRRDENPVGTWTLRVRDRQDNGHNGTLLSWSMQLWGSAIDATLAEPYRLPGDPDDEDAVFDEDATVTAELPASTPASLLPTKTYLKPTAHLPGDHAEQTGEASVSFGESYTSFPADAGYEPTAATDEASTYPTDSPTQDEVTKEEEEQAAEDDDDEYGGGSLYDGTPGYLSGMSSLVGSTTWLFVAGGTIIVFVAGVSAFFFLRKRPGQVGRGGGYDFAPMTDEDDVPMSAMERGGLLRGSEGGQSARTRELFNAFALHSDEEDESDDDDERKGGKPPRVAYTDEAVSFRRLPLLLGVECGSFLLTLPSLATLSFSPRSALAPLPFLRAQMESFLEEEDPRTPLARDDREGAPSPRRSLDEHERERQAREHFSD